MRRRTYRAHGRINGEYSMSFLVMFYCLIGDFVCLAYMSSPAHVEMIAEEKIEEVAKEDTKAAPRFSRKQLAQGKGAVPVGGGI